MSEFTSSMLSTEFQRHNLIYQELLNIFLRKVKKNYKAIMFVKL